MSVARSAAWLAGVAFVAAATASPPLEYKSKPVASDRAIAGFIATCVRTGGEPGLARAAALASDLAFTDDLENEDGSSRWRSPHGVLALEVTPDESGIRSNCALSIATVEALTPAQLLARLEAAIGTNLGRAVTLGPDRRIQWSTPDGQDHFVVFLNTMNDTPTQAQWIVLDHLQADKPDAKP